MPLSRICLRHRVQRAPVLEPLDLRLVVGVGQLDVERAPVLGVHPHGDGLADGELGAHQVDLVLGLDLVVVFGVDEGQGQHALLLQVGLVDPGEASGDDGKAAEMSGFQSSVLSGAALSVVPVTNDNPRDAFLLVVSGSGWHGIPLASSDVLDLVCLAVGGVDSTDQHVVRDVVQVPTVLQPRSRHRDVVGGGLALGLDEDRHIQLVLSIPRLEGLQKLETVAGWRDGNGDAGTVRRRCLVRILSRIISFCGEAETGRRREEELVSVLILQLIRQRVEMEAASNGHRHHKIW
jgi:hypothetical protein